MIDKENLRALLKPSMSASQQAQGIGLILLAILERLEVLTSPVVAVEKPSTWKAKG